MITSYVFLGRQRGHQKSSSLFGMKARDRRILKKEKTRSFKSFLKDCLTYDALEDEDFREMARRILLACFNFMLVGLLMLCAFYTYQKGTGCEEAYLGIPIIISILMSTADEGHIVWSTCILGLVIFLGMNHVE